MKKDTEEILIFISVLILVVAGVLGTIIYFIAPIEQRTVEGQVVSTEYKQGYVGAHNTVKYITLYFDTNESVKLELIYGTDYDFTVHSKMIISCYRTRLTPEGVWTINKIIKVP